MKTPAALSATGTGKRPRVAGRGKRNADAAPVLAALNPRALHFLAGSVPCRDKGREIILASRVQLGPAFWPLSLSLPWLSSLPLVKGGARTTRRSGKILLDRPVSGEWNDRGEGGPRAPSTWLGGDLMHQPRGFVCVEHFYSSPPLFCSLELLTRIKIRSNSRERGVLSWPSWVARRFLRMNSRT